MKVNKKGAIEMSMTTIIVIVIGVTLLILGLIFVRGIFERIGGLSDQLFAQADNIIRDNMDASQKVYVHGAIFTVNSGEDKEVFTGVQNFDDKTGKFKVQAVAGKDASADWFVGTDEEIEVMPGEKKGIPLLVQIPKGTEPGAAFSFTLKFFKNSEVYGTEKIIIKIKE